MPYKDKGMKTQWQRNHRMKTRGEDPVVQSDKGIYVDKEKAKKLVKIAYALDREIVTLGGEKVNLMDMVRYGVNGPTIRQVKGELLG